MQNMLKHSMHVLYVDNQRLGLILWQELIYSQVNYKLAVDAEKYCEKRIRFYGTSHM